MPIPTTCYGPLYGWSHDLSGYSEGDASASSKNTVKSRNSETAFLEIKTINFRKMPRAIACKEAFSDLRYSLSIRRMLSSGFFIGLLTVVLA